MKGSCHCGAVRFAVAGQVRRASVCHCSQCRKQSGGAWASATVAARDLSLEGEVRWFKATERARRGFCPICGAFLFWEAENSGEIAFALGAVDGPTGLAALDNIFVPATPPLHKGPLRDSCLCGAVTVTLDADPGEVTACHCTQCRKTSGHFPLTLDDLGHNSHIEGELAAFSAGRALRSFCPVCGTKIDFEGPSGRSLEAGLFDQLAGREPDLHIFTAFKGDYYELPKGVPAYPETGPD